MSLFRASEIGKNIKRWRNLHNMSQRALASKLDITPATLCNIEKGRITMNMFDFNNLLTITGEDANYFFYNRETTTDNLISVNIHRESYNKWLAISEEFNEVFNK